MKNNNKDSKLWSQTIREKYAKYTCVCVWRRTYYIKMAPSALHIIIWNKIQYQGGSKNPLESWGPLKFEFEVGR